MASTMTRAAHQLTLGLIGTADAETASDTDVNRAQRTPSVTVKPYPGAPHRSTDITDLATAVRVFVRVPSAQIMLACFVLGLTIRLALGVMGFGWMAFGWHDAAALAFVAASTGSFEWFVHKFVLHAPVDSFRTRVLHTSTSHRRHHEDPTILANVVLGPEHAAQYLVQLVVFSAMWATPMALLAGWPVLATIGTGTLASWFALANYEWTHMAVHTKHRFKNRFLARLQRNHRLHHFRNENYWLGVTSNSGDKLMRTLPAARSDVPLSATARSLG